MSSYLLLSIVNYAMSIVDAKIIAALTIDSKEMAGKEGRTGTHKNRSNQYIKGTAQRRRVDKVVGVKPKLEVYGQMLADMERRGVSQSEWLDMAIENFLAKSITESFTESNLP